MNRDKLSKLIKEFSLDNLDSFLFDANFDTDRKDLSFYNTEDIFKDVISLGKIKTNDNKKVIVVAIKIEKDLSERSSRKKQYDLSKKILSSENSYDAGIFVFYDKSGCFRFSLVCPSYKGIKRNWNSFRRFTYFVSNDEKITNKTFLKQIGEKDFSTLSQIKEAFSLSAVTDIFYKDFFIEYDKLVESVKNINIISDQDSVRDFVLLFVIRTVFSGFVQKKGWIGNDDKFIQNLFFRYEKVGGVKDTFYKEWLSLLFFESFNHKFSSRKYLPNEVNYDFQTAPYLNGGLFKEKHGYDDNDWIIPDKEIKDFFIFLFAHSFTIEENSLDDEDLQLNPEFLGIIFERLVNKADGAVYTPKTEVDLMCRLSLIKWLQKNLENKVKVDNLYELFFKESEKEEDQKEGSFSKKEAEEILDKLGNLAICDPAVGSGAFLVGMMQVLDEIEQILKNKYSLNGKNIFDRKKEIIKKSLYGVEVKEWAVWICQLRLWLSLFVDAPDEIKNSLEPILPSLDFKVRQGDSLVQRIGSKTFPISGHNLALNKSTKDKITKLKNLKLQYFDNKSDLKDWELKQREIGIYEEILSLEIKEKENQWQILKNIKPIKVMSLFGDEEKNKQEILDLDKEKIEKLEDEIFELKEQKQALRNGGKPLVWSIEFSEVFAEKDGFDLLIGNPPYIRQESIADPTGKIKDKKEYKNYLQEMVKMDFPNEFLSKMKINAQSDLYMYFYIRGLRLLNSQGIHTFICSNSWLDVGYGAWIQNFLIKKCPVELIIDNHAKRSFGAADVNTIISIIHAPQKKINENHLVKFVAFKKSYEESVYTENILAIENAQKIQSNDVFRVYPITIKDLKEAGTEYEEGTLTKQGEYIGDKWGGKYLRAPDIFFTIMEKGKNKLVKLGDIADVKFGIKTGANDFFYLTDEKIKQWNIEEEFLKPVIKSPRECKSILVDYKDLKYKIFICNKSKEELEGTNTLKYIKWGEKKGFNKKATVANRKYWWQNPNFGSKVFMQMSYNDIFKFWYSKDEIRCDARLYTISLKTEEDVYLLNSTLSALIIELLGRANLGEGALDFKVYEADQIIVLNKEKNKVKINRDIFLRPIKSIFEECGIDPKSDVSIENQYPKPLLDRAELDKIVFDAIGLTEDERNDVYRAVCRLVWNRISKAKSV
jgi:hypothetical protein